MTHASRRWVPGLLALAAVLGACTPAPKPGTRYMVGEPYSLGGLWSYPREEFALTEAGIAAVMPANRPAGLTANGEAWDPQALIAAHRTLQLPAIVTVTNLETGLALRVRVNDRGPAQPGRIVALSPRAATLLGIPQGGAAQVRLEVDGEASRALAAGLPSTERRGPEIAAAPRPEVVAETLAPLAGARSAAPQAAAAPTAVRAVAAETPAAPPARLPEELRRGAPAPGRLVVEAGTFFQATPAQRQAARLAGLGARVQPMGRGRQATYRVVMGPFASLAEADRAVAGVLAAGLPEVRLLVE